MLQLFSPAPPLRAAPAVRDAELYENPGYDLKVLLGSGKSDEYITTYILECIKKKPEGIISKIRAKELRPTLNLMHRIGG